MSSKQIDAEDDPKPIDDCTIPLKETHEQPTFSPPIFFPSTYYIQPPLFDASPPHENSAPLFDASPGFGTQGTHSTAGVNENLFDREKWNEVASLLREIDESQGTEQGLAAAGASPMKPYHKTTESFAKTYKRRRPRKKDIVDFFQCPTNLGCQLALFQLTNKATTRGSKLVSSTRFPFSHRCLSDVEKAMELWGIIMATPMTKKMQNCSLLTARQDLHYRTTHSCTASRSCMIDSFLDASTCKSSFIHFFATCLMLDDKAAQPNSPSYRIILPIHLAYCTGSPYSHAEALLYLRGLVDPEELLHAKLVFLPVYHSRDVTCGEGLWSLYCLNLIHGQIDILDPYPWTNEEDRTGYRVAIAGRIHGRLNAVFQEHTDGMFTDFSQFGLPFVSVPKFDALYIMLFMEHYDGALRKIFVGIDPEFGTQYKAQILYYIIFHKLNANRKELPEEIRALAPR